MPNARVDFYKPDSLTQSLKLDISDKFHIFPGGMVSSQMVDARARNITIEVAGRIVTKSFGFTLGTGKGIEFSNNMKYNIGRNMLKIVFNLTNFKNHDKDLAQANFPSKIMYNEDIKLDV